MKRLLLPLLTGLSFPIVHFVTLVFLRAFRAPESVTVLGALINALLVFLLTYALVYIVQKKRPNRIMVEPPPPTF